MKQPHGTRPGVKTVSQGNRNSPCPDETRSNRKPFCKVTSKVEVAFQTLLKQGHNVQAVVRSDVIWFDIDGDLLVSWDQMSEFADGLHTLEELRDLHRRRSQVVLKSA